MFLFLKRLDEKCFGQNQNQSYLFSGFKLLNLKFKLNSKLLKSVSWLIKIRIVCESRNKLSFENVLFSLLVVRVL